MGITHLKCAASGLGIVSEPIALVLVADDGGRWAPLAPPLFGHYDSYGSIELPTLTDGARATLEGFVALERRGALTFSAQGRESTSEISEANLRALLEDVRQGMILRALGDESWVVRAGGKPLGFTVLLWSIFEAIVSVARKEMPTEERDELADAPLAELVAKALGAPDVAPALVSEANRDDLVDLVHARSWFDARRAWTPAEGAQFSNAELRAMANAAKKDLAAWPPLVRAIQRYEGRLV